MSSTKQIEKSMYYDLLHPWFGTGLLTSTGIMNKFDTGSFVTECI